MKPNSSLTGRFFGFTLTYVFFVSLAVAFTARPLFGEKEKASQPESFKLQPGDRLQIVVYREDDLSGVYEIDPTGKLTFPLIEGIQGAGLKMEELREMLTSSLKKYLVDPQVSISRAETTIKSISVLGHVAKPGIYDYAPGSTLMRLISEAGGFVELANKRKVRIIRMVHGKKKVLVVNCLNIIDGKEDDPAIEAGDIIFVPESVF